MMVVNLLCFLWDCQQENYEKEEKGERNTGEDASKDTEENNGKRSEELVEF